MGFVKRITDRLRMREVGRVYSPDLEDTSQVIMSMPTKEASKDLRIMEKPNKPKREHHKLTREEMWVMLCDKHHFLRHFHINPQYMSDDYIKRNEIWDFFVELNLHNSPKLTDKQKQKIKREIVDKI